MSAEHLPTWFCRPRIVAGEDSTGHAGTIATNSLSVARQTYFSPATKLAMKFAVEIGLKDSM